MRVGIVGKMLITNPNKINKPSPSLKSHGKMHTNAMKMCNKVHQKGVIKGLQIQWGSEIRSFEIQNRLKSVLFEGLISNGCALTWL